MGRTKNGTVSTYPDDLGNLLHLDYPLERPFDERGVHGQKVRHTPTGMVGIFSRGISPLREYEAEVVLDDGTRITVWACHLEPAE